MYGDKYWYRHGQWHRDGILPAAVIVNCNKDEYSMLMMVQMFTGIERKWTGRQEWWKYGNQYTFEQVVENDMWLTRFAKRCTAKLRAQRLKRVRWIHGELLCKPPTNNFSGGRDYHRMVGYFNNL